jgi:hypothetical protein
VTLTFRDTKGSNLTADEVDANFRDLDGRVDTLESTPPVPNNIAEIEVSGSQMTVIMEDASEFGPFTLPTARWRWREDFADATVYAVDDFFSDPDTGSIYRVLIGHTSADPFDPDLLSGGDPVYQLILDASGFGGGGLGGFTTVSTLSSSTPTLTAAQANTFFLLDTTSNSVDIMIPDDSTSFDVPVGTVYGFFKLVDANTASIDHSAGLTKATEADTTVRRLGTVFYVRKIDVDTWIFYGDFLDRSRLASLKSVSGAGPVSVTWTSYQPGIMVHHSHTSGVTINLPLNSGQPKYNRGDEIRWVQAGAGQLTFDVPSGTLQKRAGTTGRTVAQYSVVTLKKVDLDVWLLYGDYE